MNPIKKIGVVFLLSLSVYFDVRSQNVGINATGATPDASAMLDIASTSKGLLVPRVALTATNAAGPVTSPTTSLLVYNTATAGTIPNNVIPGYYYWSGTAWIAFTNSAPASTAWTLGGNTGVTAANFVGTGDDRALIFKSNNLSFLEFGRRQTLGLVDGYPEYTDANEKVTYIRSALQFEAPGASFYKPKMWTDVNGNFRVKGASAGTDYFEFGSTGTANAGGFEFIIGDDGDEPILFKSYHYINGMSEIMRLQSGRMAVGSNAFDGTNPEKLLIDAGATTSYNLMTGKGSIDNYLQINVKNSSATGSASSDLVASADNGTESVNYIDMGINSSAYSNTSLPVLGGTNTAYLYAAGNDFVIGNATAARPLRFFTGGTANTNERMRIDGTGRVGIANLAPSEALDVTGNVRFSGALMPNNSAGTAGNVLQSNGSGAAPTWVTPASAIGGWALDGNAVAANRNFGTTTNFSLPFITNNTERMRISNVGNVGIGTSTFNGTYPEKFIVDAGTTTSVNAIVGKGSINNYLQLNIQNNNAGTNASSDVVATADNGSETTNFIDMGINSSVNTSGAMGGANDSYLYNIGQNLLIGTGTAAKSVVFMTGGTSQVTNERMRIDGTGNVGIGNNTPTRKLDVNGAIGTGMASTTNGSLVFSNSSNANSVTLNSGVTAASYVLTLPTAQGATNTVLANNGSGTLSWSSLSSVGGTWSTLGNAGTNPATNFLGTTDNQALVFKVNNAQVGRFQPNAVAIGLAATTNNSTNAYAIGSGATVGFSHPNSFVIGNSAAANSDNSFAIGNSATVAGNSSYAMGNSAASNSTNGIALGTSATVAFSITDGIAIGTNALANSNNSIAIGGNITAASKTSANAANAIALGVTATSNSANAIAIGTGATTGFSLVSPVAIGNAAVVNGSNGVALGNGSTTSSAANATAIGAATSVTGNNSTAVGHNTAVTQNNALILGDLTNPALSVGIGSQAFSGTNREKLLVDMGTSTSVNAIVGRGTNPSYLQLNIQNLSNGGGASSDVVATADNGSETNNFIDMGINSSANTSGAMGGANDAYLYNLGQNLLIGTGTAAKSVVFMTGGTSQVTNERMRIDGTGNVGIGNIAPTQKLDVTGNVRFSGALMPNNASGTAGQVLQSNGAGVTPTWVAPGGSNWTLDGNAVAANRNFGTTTNFPVPFITNNTEKMRLFPAGGLAIGVNALDGTNPEELLVDAGTTTSYNVISGKGSIDNYLQLNIQNRSTGTVASSDIVASANNATESVNFVDLGINSSGYSSTGVLGGANNAYLYSTGNDFVIGNATANRNLEFFTGGTAVANERMRIDGTGNVGIGNIAPTQKLDVTGNIRFSGAIMPNNIPGAVGEVLLSGGAGASPYWTNPTAVLNAISWGLDGNAVGAARNFGTTSNFALPFITNNTEKMRLFPTGGLAIGINALDGTNPEELLVDAGTTTSYNVISGKGSIDNYLQLNIQNRSTGTLASSDIVASANNATESVNFVDLGINSSGYSSTGVLGGANNAYLYSTGNDFIIGNATASRNLEFFTGGTAVGNERMTITGAGNVGIGINTPNSTLSVNGSLTLAYRSGTGAYAVLATDHIIINTGAAASWTLPAATSCSGRIYRLVNQGTGNITLSQSVTTASGITTTALPSGATGNFEIISDGSVWRKIN